MIDAFGKLKVGSSVSGNFRIIAVSETQIAVFGEGVDPQILELDGPYAIKARRMTATTSDGQVIEFTRAGCGCQTPNSLRGPRSKFIALLSPADA